MGEATVEAVVIDGSRTEPGAACAERPGPSDWELVERARRRPETGPPHGAADSDPSREAPHSEPQALPGVGDAGAFAALFERHARAVFTYLLRLTSSAALAEDLTQEAFLAAFRRLDDLRPERTAGGQTSTLRPWLLRVARNLAFSHFRRNPACLSLDRGPETHDGGDDVWGGSTAGPEEETLRQETAAEVRQAVARLSPRYREPLLLYYAGGLTYGEIAFVLGTPLGTVATRIRRGVAAAGKELARLGDREPAAWTDRSPGRPADRASTRRRSLGRIQR